jgi:hypothetical protein
MNKAQVRQVLKRLSSVLAALTIAQTDIYKVLQTPFYDPSGSLAGESCGSLVIATNASGLPEDIISRVNELKPDYLKASQTTNVPWEMFAGIHYRETSFSTTSTNIFQITGYHGPTDLQSQLIAAGSFIQKHSVPSNLSNHRAPLQPSGNDPDEIKDTLYSYNGRAKQYAQQAESLGFNADTQPYEGSPYVMNNYDSVHQNMGIITHDNGGLDGTDTRFGAFTIFARLGGSTIGSGACEAVAGNAVQTAINYAWANHHDPNYCNEKPSYKKAIEAAQARGEYVGGTCTIDGVWVGVDCGAFVTRVMRDSGADKNYNQYEGATDSQIRYLDEHPQLYQKLSNVTGTQDLLPGDIAINSTHTYIFVGEQPGFNGNSASASFSSTGQSWRAPMASDAYGFSEFSWYRLKVKP